VNVVAAARLLERERLRRRPRQPRRRQRQRQLPLIAPSLLLRRSTVRVFRFVAALTGMIALPGDTRAEGRHDPQFARHHTGWLATRHRRACGDADAVDQS
jgi:hypothetical protein